VTADAGEPDTGGTAEDHTEAGDTTLGQAAETLAREEAATQQTASPAVDAATTASPGTAAATASPSETKPKRQRRVID
jgi:hypothetical protein